MPFVLKHELPTLRNNSNEQHKPTCGKDLFCSHLRSNIIKIYFCDTDYGIYDIYLPKDRVWVETKNQSDHREIES